MAVKDKRSRLLKKSERKKRQAERRRDRGWPQAARRSEQALVPYQKTSVMCKV